MGNYWQDSPSTTTPLSAANLNAREDVVASQFRSIVFPLAYSYPPTSVGVLVALRISIVRFVMPRAGTLAGIAYWIGTSSGNYDCGVYDTGEASAGNRTRLYNTGSTAMPAGGQWREFAAPALAVTAGQSLDIAIHVDNATATLGRWVMGSSANGVLFPAGYFDAPGGASPKTMGQGPTSGAIGLPATIAEASVGDPGITSVASPVIRIT